MLRQAQEKKRLRRALETVDPILAAIDANDGGGGEGGVGVLGKNFKLALIFPQPFPSPPSFQELTH